MTPSRTILPPHTPHFIYFNPDDTISQHIAPTPARLEGKYPKCKSCVTVFSYCQALSISQSLNLSLSLRDRDRADTIITFHHHPPQKTF